jgi:hypothetical protein
MRRRVPQALYDAVFEITTAIAQPDTLVGADVDSVVAEEARAKLVGLFQSRQAAGNPDPFLTETLADFTINDAEAVRLYRLALAQSVAFPGEATHTKRLGLVERLIAMGRTAEAVEELDRARRDAFAAGDTEVIKELNALASKLVV